MISKLSEVHPLILRKLNMTVEGVEKTEAIIEIYLVQIDRADLENQPIAIAHADSTEGQDKCCHYAHHIRSRYYCRP